MTAEYWEDANRIEKAAKIAEDLGLADGLRILREMGKKKHMLDDEEYIRLLRADRKLSALESGGVTNWDGYEEALDDYVDPVYSELAAALLEKLKEYTKTGKDLLGESYDIVFSYRGEDLLADILHKVSKGYDAYKLKEDLKK